MPIAPVFKSLIAFAFVKSKCGVNFHKRNLTYLSCLNDAERIAYKIGDDTVTIGYRRFFGFDLVDGGQASRCKFLALDNKLRQLQSHLRRVAKKPGLKRRGFDAERISAIKKAYRTVFMSGKPMADVKEELAQSALTSADVGMMLEFINRSERGILR